MEITNAQLRDNTLSLTLKPPYADAQKLIYKFKPGSYELAAVREKKRSLDANKYLWKLVTTIAQAVGISAEDVYRRAVREYGVCETIKVHYKAVNEFSRIWESRGIAWFTELADLEGDYRTMLVYSGSSCYNTGDMSRLIDGVIQDARNLEIETLTERELSLLLDAWKKEGTNN